MSNQKLVFDVTKAYREQREQQLVVGRVGDGGLKAVDVTLFSNGFTDRYDLQGLTVIFEGLKPDKTRVIDTTGGVVVDPKKGVFRYLFPTQAFTAQGDYAQAIFKIMRGHQVETTLEFRMKVLENKVEFGINSEDYITEYLILMDKLQESFDESLEKLQGQSKATQAEIDEQKEAVHAIDERVKMLLGQIQTFDLSTRDDLNALKTTLEQEINNFGVIIANIESKVVNEVENMKREVSSINRKLQDTDWKNITVASGFKGDTDAPPQYRIKGGTVLLRGLIFPDKGKKAGKMFSLPKEAQSKTPYRQGFLCGQITTMPGASALVYVHKGGNVDLISISTETGLWLDAIRFENS